jgi:hypothetical protein
MPPGFIACVFWFLSLFALWGIAHDLRTGVATSRGWRFPMEDAPILFLLVILSKGFVIGLAVAETRYAMGFGSNPILYLNAMLPHWQPCPGPR